MLLPQILAQFKPQTYQALLRTQTASSFLDQVHKLQMSKPHAQSGLYGTNQYSTRHITMFHLHQMLQALLHMGGSPFIMIL